MSKTIGALTVAESPVYIIESDLIPIERDGYTFRSYIHYGTAANCTVRLDSSGSMPAVDANTVLVTNPVTSSETTLLTALDNIHSGIDIPWSIANGGTGAETAQDAVNNLLVATDSGKYARGNGTNIVMSTIQAADVPTLNQNTTGNADTATLAARATNIAGGAANSFPYQSGANVTAMFATANSSVLSTNGSGVPVWTPLSSFLSPVVGTFTPIDASGTGLVFSGVSGSYIEIGRLVYFTLQVVYPVTGDTANAKIGALPFTSSAVGPVSLCQLATTAGGGISSYVSINDTVIQLVTSSLGAVGNATFSGAEVNISGCYIKT